MKPLDQMTEADLLEASDEELGLLLAEHIFGLKPHNTVYGRWRVFLPNKIYFTDDLASTGNGMLEVIEAMGKRGFEFDISFPRRGKKYLVCFDEKNAINCQHTYHPSLSRAVAKSIGISAKLE